jgi:hypothetical protein
VGDALASSKRSGKSIGFLLATYTAAGETIRPPTQIAALHGDECVDKLKCDPDNPRGARHWSASSRRELVAPSRIVSFHRAVPLSNPWLEPIC